MRGPKLNLFAHFSIQFFPFLDCFGYVDFQHPLGASEAEKVIGAFIVTREPPDSWLVILTAQTWVGIPIRYITMKYKTFPDFLVTLPVADLLIAPPDLRP